MNRTLCQHTTRRARSLRLTPLTLPACPQALVTAQAPGLNKALSCRGEKIAAISRLRVFAHRFEPTRFAHFGSNPQPQSLQIPIALVQRRPLTL